MQLCASNLRSLNPFLEDENVDPEAQIEIDSECKDYLNTQLGINLDG